MFILGICLVQILMMACQYELIMLYVCIFVLYWRYSCCTDKFGVYFEQIDITYKI